MARVLVRDQNGNTLARTDLDEVYDGRIYEVSAHVSDSDEDLIVLTVMLTYESDDAEGIYA